MLKYLDEQFLYEDEAKITDIQVEENNQVKLVLDSTIFYPKGGGQPSDSGEIISENNQVFVVEGVKMMENIPYHMGYYKNGNAFKLGDKVKLLVNKEQRVLYSKLHTLGHLIDEAMLNLGYYEYIKPSKGYHYPDGPSVEYLGDLSQFDLEKIKLDVENEVIRMMKVGFTVKTLNVPLADLEKHCHKITFDPTLILGNNIRVVVVWGDKGITCGGIHVKNINEIAGCKVTKIISKKNNVKISYRLS